MEIMTIIILKNNLEEIKVLYSEIDMNRKTYKNI
jgi:hypothetical protein